MPSYGEKQKPAGVQLPCPERCKPVGERSMESRLTNVKIDLKVDNIEYKGNTVLRANR